MGLFMKGVLYYFSGTGNTKWVADKFKDSFKLYDIDLHLINIESIEQVNIKSYAFVIIGSPVYAEVPPKIVEDFLNKLPKLENRIKTIIYSTQGAKSAAAASIISRKLEQKGYNVVIQSNIRMPNNYYFYIGKQRTEIEQREMMQSAKIKVKELTKCFMDNKQVREHNSSLRIFLSKISSNTFKNMMPRLSKNITSTKECTKCGLCLRNCPRGNITFEDGHAIFHSKCILCLRCIYICPINAIRYKGKKIDQIQKYRIESLDLSK